MLRAPLAGDLRCLPLVRRTVNTIAVAASQKDFLPVFQGKAAIKIGLSARLLYPTIVGLVMCKRQYRAATRARLL